MARIKDREKALELRKKEMSYSQIKDTLGVSKSTLSYWLKDYPLSKKRIGELRGHNDQRIERFRGTMKKKKEDRLEEFYKLQKKKVLPLSKREVSLLGLMLYWGEGTKSRMDSLEVANSDPAMIRFYIHWVTYILQMPKGKIKIKLHLYKDMDIDDEIDFWSKTVKLPKNQFAKPYIKKSISDRINHKGSFGHGTCQIRIHDTRMTEKVFMGIRCIKESC